ncbi:MAG: Resolvase [uncultured Sulfurovum sp.]|uniref:Resolvase n=1 Tax=uncultured Sulfurovum sp. TaxID=269237 RepID=A0A6S6SGD6_9BACT|nr:MAG: Resolvase [uncultured Sulfurovum sp.]
MKGTQKHYGYCRVSTSTQDTEKQKFALLNYAHANKFQFTQIQEIVISSRKSKKDREINSLLTMLKNEDHLYITKLDRLGRNTKEVLEIIDELKSKNIILHIIKDNIIVDPLDTNPITTMFLTLLSAFSQMERDFISERTKAGLAKARNEGKLIGKQKGSISNNTQFEEHKEKIREYLNLGLSYEKIVKNIGVGSKSSLFSFVKHRANYFKAS